MVSISSDILKIKQEVESELVGEDADQDHADVDIQLDTLGLRYKVLQLRKVARKIKQEVESELFCDDVNASVKKDALYLGPSKNAAAPLSAYGGSDTYPVFWKRPGNKVMVDLLLP
ncbi:hypothetical protein P3S67_029857 [Capsicum chacoense]